MTNEQQKQKAAVIQQAAKSFVQHRNIFFFTCSDPSIHVHESKGLASGQRADVGLFSENSLDFFVSMILVLKNRPGVYEAFMAAVVIAAGTDAGDVDYKDATEHF